jgi:tetratricopeptide (TPR) repeat protein
MVLAYQKNEAVFLKREYAESLPYCAMHSGLSSPDYHLLDKELLSLIPADPNTTDFCQHFLCSECVNGWFEIVNWTDEKGESYPHVYAACLCTNKNQNPWNEERETWLSDCKNRIVYQGYFNEHCRKYFKCFNKHIQYCKNNKNCSCYWPELNELAASINNEAYDMFRDLFENTKLNHLIDSKDQLKLVMNTNEYLFNLHGLTLFCIDNMFKFSDYVMVCRDIEEYSFFSFEEFEYLKIKDKLESLLAILHNKFMSLYKKCLRSHPNDDIRNEMIFLKFYANDDLFSGDLEPSFPVPTKTLIDSIDYQNEYLADKAKGAPESLFLLEHGTFLNSMLLYDQAIDILTHALKLDPSRPEAYIERALAYFEINQLELAISDYETAKKLKTIPPFQRAIYIPKNKIKFATGLISGILEGSQQTFVGFVPSIFDSITGISHGLWAFASDPSEVSQEMINTAYMVGEFISSHSTEECFQCVIPELKELSQTWNTLADKMRGHKIGYIVGKYGLDILIPAGMVKGVAKLKAIRRANTMLTLENCAASNAKQATILAEATKRSAARTALIESSKNGKILIKSVNVKPHVLQKKHAWNKLIKLTGNIEIDFKNVILLLEEQGISSHQYTKKTLNVVQGVVRREHEKIILNQHVKVVFVEYTATGEMFLNDAWVVK